MSELWYEIFQIIGKLVEIFGVLLMASKYINIPAMEIPWELFKALFGKTRQGLAIAAQITPDYAKTVTKGLGYLILGIIIQMIPYIVFVIMEFNKKSASH